MRNLLIVCLVSLLSLLAFGQEAAAAAKGEPKAIIETTAGKMTCTLYPDNAPKGVANFIGLATGKKDWTDPKTGAKKHGVPLYDGTIFHRVIPQFMIQGGDPAGTGTGGSGDKFGVEDLKDLKFDKGGQLAYANAGPNTNESQFFITEVATGLSAKTYTIFGQCDEETVELVKKIARMPRNSQDFPNNPVKIKHITIEK